MAVTAMFFNSFFKNLMNGNIDLDTHTLKVALTSSAYTPDRDLHEDFADVTNEITGTGYTAGGATLASCAVTQDNTNDLAKFDAADAAWTTATFTARQAVLYRDTGVAGTSYLIAVIDFGADQTVSGGTFTIQWHADGILTLKTGA